MFIPRRKYGVSVTVVSRFKIWLAVGLDNRITICMKHSRSWDAVNESAFWQIPEGSYPRSQEPTNGSYHNPTTYFSTIRVFRLKFCVHFPYSHARYMTLFRSFFRGSNDKHKLRILSVGSALSSPSYSNFVRRRYKCKYPTQPWFKLHIHKRNRVTLYLLFVPYIGLSVSDKTIQGNIKNIQIE